MATSRRISALVVSYNTCALTLEAIRSVVNEPEAETIVVDNASHDGSADAIARSFPSVKLICSERNLGYAGGVNLAARSATGELLLVLNADALLTPGALERLGALLEQQSRAALVGPALLYADGRPQAAAFKFPGLLQVTLDLFPIDRLMDAPLNGRIYATEPRTIDHPLGACMLVRRRAWEDVGPLDEGYFMYAEEVDWCYRARQRGWQIWHEPRAVVIHHAGSSTRQRPRKMLAQLWRSRLRYYTRYHGPMYNRVVHAIVRIGLARRGSQLESVRQLAA